LRSELLSIDQLERHAVTLAGAHRVDPHPGKDRLLPRLAENERVLLAAYEVVAAAAATEQRILPAEAWLLDNYYLIEQQIGPPAPTSRLQPGTAATDRRPFGRLSADLRPRSRSDLASGRPRGPGQRRRVSGCLSDHGSVESGGVVGFSDDATPGVARERPPRGFAYRKPSREAGYRDRLGRSHARGSWRGPQTADPRAGRVRRRHRAADGSVRGGLLCKASGPGPGSRRGPGLAGASACRPGHERGPVVGGRESQRRGRPDINRQ
jgi:hypothetical protein